MCFGVILPEITCRMRKKLFIIHLFVLVCISSYGQNVIQENPFFNTYAASPSPNFTRKFITIGVGYELGLPTGSMSNSMSPVHSVSVSSSLPMSFITPNLQMGIDLTYGLYGSKRFGINYRQNGNYINTAVQYSSDIAQAGIHANYLFFSKKRVQPYVTAKVGYAELTSSFMVEDPWDIDACRPLENETIYTDGTVYWSYGIGFRWNVGHNNSNAKHFIDFSIANTNGNSVEYINVNDLHDHHAPLTATANTTPINIAFANASNQNVHQHRIAELYNNPFSVLQIKVAYLAYLRLKRR
jgi:hypothetical protein